MVAKGRSKKDPKPVSSDKVGIPNAAKKKSVKLAECTPLKHLNENLSEGSPASPAFPATPFSTRKQVAAKTPASIGARQLFPAEEAAVVSHLLSVHLRIRPLVTSTDRDGGRRAIDSVDSKWIEVSPTSNTYAYRSLNGKPCRFEYDNVFPEECPQVEVMDKIGSPMVRAFLEEGKDGLVFAYGTTNSGKTYTMQGSPAEPGLMTRSLAEIMDVIDAHNQSLKSKTSAPMSPPLLDKKFKYSLSASYCEVYNEQIFDLLLKGSKKKRMQPLTLNEDATGNLFLKGLTEKPVKTISDGESVLETGQANRHIGGTVLNDESSRSHSIFALTLYRADASRGRAPKVPFSKFWFVDLAGSERVGRANTTGDRLKESAKINSSLAVLSRCMETLRWNQAHPKSAQRVVPFRESKITRLFQGCLSGGGNAVLIVNVSPSDLDLDETLHSLRFAALSSEVDIASKVDTWRKDTTNEAHVPAVFDRLHANTTHEEDASDDQSDGGTSPSSMSSQSWEVERDELLLEIDNLCQKLIESEERFSQLEAQVREEVAEEMADTLKQMEVSYQQRLQREQLISEQKLQKRIELVRREIMNPDHETEYPMHTPETQELVAENDRLRSRLMEISEGSDALTEAKSSLERDVAALKQRLDEQSATERSLSEQVAYLSSELEQSVDKLTDAERRVLEASASLEQVKIDHDHVLLKLQEATEEHEREQSIMAESHANELGTLAAKLSEVEQKLEASAADHDAMTREMAERDGIIGKIEADAHRFCEERDAAVQKAEEYHKQMLDSEAHTEAVWKENTDLKDQLAAMAAELEEAKRRASIAEVGVQMSPSTPVDVLPEASIAEVLSTGDLSDHEEEFFDAEPSSPVQNTVDAHDDAVMPASPAEMATMASPVADTPRSECAPIAELERASPVEALHDADADDIDIAPAELSTAAGRTRRSKRVLTQHTQSNVKASKSSKRSKRGAIDIFRTPKTKELVSRTGERRVSAYQLIDESENVEEAPEEPRMWSGKVASSISGQGVSVTFDSVEAAKEAPSFAQKSRQPRLVRTFRRKRAQAVCRSEQDAFDFPDEAPPPQKKSAASKASSKLRKLFTPKKVPQQSPLSDVDDAAASGTGKSRRGTRRTGKRAGLLARSLRL